MKKSLIAGILIILLLLASCAEPPVDTTIPTTATPRPVTLELSQVKVACEYQNIASADFSVNMQRIVSTLRETQVDFVFRSFFKLHPWPINCAQFRQPDLMQLCERQGNSYEHFKEVFNKMKEELPSVIFCTGVSAGTIGIKPGRCEWNPKTGELFEQPELWDMATDPEKWGISISKETFQYEYARRMQLIPKDLDFDLFDWQTPDAYIPDITNPSFQELLLSWVQGQIDAGANAIWLDILTTQARMLHTFTRDVNHPAVQESYQAASKIVDEIHNYGEYEQ